MRRAIRRTVEENVRSARCRYSPFTTSVPAPANFVSVNARRIGAVLDDASQVVCAVLAMVKVVEAVQVMNR